MLLACDPDLKGFRTGNCMARQRALISMSMVVMYWGLEASCPHVA